MWQYSWEYCNQSARHKHYICECQRDPILTEPQAIIVGIVFFIIMMIGTFFITRNLNVSKWERLIVLVILALIDYKECSVATFLLYAQVSG